MQTRFKKTYVTVNVDIDPNGTFYPRLIRWKDGMVFEIREIRYRCRAASDKVDGGGIRYTVVIGGRESLLFREGDRWFVEAKGAPI